MFKHLMGRLRRSEEGLVAMELALMAPLVLALLITAIDVGNAIMHKMELTSAVRAGVQYARANSTETAAIATVVKNATDHNPDTITVTTTVFCEASDGGNADCDAPSADDRKLVTVTATENYAPLFYPDPTNPDSIFYGLTPFEGITVLTAEATLRIN